jgi:hypothetical protein
MNTPPEKIVLQPERNPTTKKAHQREVAWQIVVPLILGLIIILGLAAWVVIMAVQGGNVSQPADTSLIFLLIPAMLMALIPLVIFIGLAYGVILLNYKLPQYFFQAQTAMQKVRDGVQAGADKLAEPVIRVNSIAAALGAIRRKK